MKKYICSFLFLFGSIGVAGNPGAEIYNLVSDNVEGSIFRNGELIKFSPTEKATCSLRIQQIDEHGASEGMDGWRIIFLVEHPVYGTVSSSDVEIFWDKAKAKNLLSETLDQKFSYLAPATHPAVEYIAKFDSEANATRIMYTDFAWASYKRFTLYLKPNSAEIGSAEVLSDVMRRQSSAVCTNFKTTH
jgi:hypothetical protein